jgi:predicted Zn-dependent protease
VTDNLRLPQARQRRAEAKQAAELMAKGDPNAAIRILEDARRLGDDRNVDKYLAEAYRAAGMTAQADTADLRYRKLLESRMF